MVNKNTKPTPQTKTTYLDLAKTIIQMETDHKEEITTLKKVHKKEVTELKREIKQLQNSLTKILEEVEQLKSRLNTNSSNSSKPPSSDSFTKPTNKNRSLRTSTGKTVGKQPGTPGNFLKQTKNPDRTIQYQKDNCTDCSESLATIPGRSIEKRQIFDIPPIQIQTTEHQLIEKHCPCGTINVGAFPDDLAPTPVKYGKRIQTLAYFLNLGQYIPVGRTKIILKCLGINVSTGWIAGLGKVFSPLLEDPLNEISQLLRSADVAHFDETGLQVDSSLHWVHSSSTTDVTLYHLDKKRGKVGIDAMGVLPFFTGVAVHDGWVAYKQFDAAIHALCNAHHLRELNKLCDDYPDLGWVKTMRSFLARTHEKVEASKAAMLQELTESEVLKIFCDYQEILRVANLESPQKTSSKTGGRTKQTAPRNLLNRFVEYETEVLRFVTNFAVPFDNNLAERDIRMVKVKQKVSSSFRTVQGAKNFLCSRSILSTAAKQGVDGFELLVSLLNGEKWVPVRVVS